MSKFTNKPNDCPLLSPQVYTFKRGSQQRQKYPDNIIFYFSFFLGGGTNDWAWKLTHARQALYPWIKLQLKPPKNLCYLSICIWYKKNDQGLGLTSTCLLFCRPLSALWSLPSPVRATISSKPFHIGKWKQEWLGFPGGRMKFRERLLSFWAHQTKLLTSPCSIFFKYQMEIVGTGWALWPSPSSFNVSISNK